MATLNLGILAHVDAGKTSLTERLLYATGVIDEVGSVDAGSTQTDTLALERQRGITIKSAVASFAIDDLAVNLIDTPGHPDFIAEVERVLGVLDGAVLVISAVEGVQPQTRILWRALQRLRIPTLLFVNKIDRRGAGDQRVLAGVSGKLTPAAVPMGSAYGLGSRDAGFRPYDIHDPALGTTLIDVLSDHDEALLAAYVHNAATVTGRHVRASLIAQTRRARVHPVFFGSALTGAGVDSLLAGIKELLPAAGGSAHGPVSGTVFKIERGAGGERVAYIRLFDGTVRTRERVRLPGEKEGKVSAIRVFRPGSAATAPLLSAGQIGRVWGLGDVRVSDAIGVPRRRWTHSFAPPTLESVVVPDRSADRGPLHVALTRLAEQDPLINLRLDERRREIVVSLYGEVQKEVIQATLADDFGLDVTFLETTPICVERPAGTGAAVEILNAESNPFLATVGLRVEPAPDDSGIEFRLDVDTRTVPIYLYKSVGTFADIMERHVRQTLREGLFGWQVTDCIVTMTRCTYSSWDGPPATRGPLSTAADFQKLTPLVVMDALRAAGSQVHEPMQRFTLDVPEDSLGAVLPALAALRATPGAPVARGSSYVIEGSIPAARVHALQRQLPGLTRGDGVVESSFSHYAPVSGAPPTRPRTALNPLNRKEYLLHVARRG